MKKTELQLIIISAERRIFTGAVASVTIPGISGNFGVYPDHAPLISPLQKGIISYKVGGTEKTLEVQGGIAEINNGIVTICVESAAKK